MYEGLHEGSKEGEISWESCKIMGPHEKYKLTSTFTDANNHGIMSRKNRNIRCNGFRPRRRLWSLHGLRRFALPLLTL